MRFRRRSWHWYKHAEVEKEMLKQIDLSPVGKHLKCEMSSALEDLCWDRFPRPIELPRVGSIRTLRVKYGTATIFIYFVENSARSGYIALHAALGVNETPPTGSLALAQRRFAETDLH